MYASIELSRISTEIVEQAQSFAKHRQHAQLDSPHLFLAFCKSKHLDEASKRIQSVSESLKKSLESAMDDWYGTASDEFEMTANYISIMRVAHQYAVELESPYIEPDHLLEAIFEIDSMLQDWLQEHDFLLPRRRVKAHTPHIDTLGRDITALARQGSLPVIYGRDSEINQLTEILLRHGKNSAMLLGLPGVGKTAVIECLAQRIITDDVPQKLQDKRLVEINIGSLIAGTTFRGELEERIQNLLDEIQKSPDIILVIDEFHTIMGAGTTADSNLDIANILKPALARGDLTCIGITTNAEYDKHIAPDAALGRRFENITIAEPDIEATREILEQLIPIYENHNHVTITSDDLTKIINLAAQYLPSRQFPDKAIDIIGRASSRAEIQQKPQVRDVIDDVVSEMAGVPVGQTDNDTKSRLTTLEDTLCQEIIGQEDVVHTIARAIRLAYTGLRDPDRPKGVFLFAGPSGVGKTELAKALSRHLFNNILIRLDMSEYAERISMTKLVGAPPGYVGHGEPGQLTQALRDNPHSVVLFDEVEKAHPDVFDVFLQLFDEGRLTDAMNRPVDARHAIFIMTTNLGTKTPISRGLGLIRVMSPKPNAEDVQQALKNFFRPEFLNRIDHVCSFRTLDLDDLADIAEIEVEMFKNRLQKQNVRLTYERRIMTDIAEKAMALGAGARGIPRAVETHIAVPLSEMLMNAEPNQEAWVHIDYQNNDLHIGWL